MKKFFLNMLLISILAIGGAAMAKDLEQPFNKGEINPYSEFFTGRTYLNMLCTNDTVWNSSIGNVTFEPKARTNWHKHSGGQILLATAGEGRYQEKGKPIQITWQNVINNLYYNEYGSFAFNKNYWSCKNIIMSVIMLLNI